MKKIIITVFLLAFFMCANAFAFNARLSWDHLNGTSPGPEVKGYEVCYGVESRNYSNIEFVGAVDEYNVVSLSDGTMYYFSVRTVGWNGIESPFSEEVWTDGYKIYNGDGDLTGGGCFIIILFD